MIKTAILSDFDGTLIPVNALNILYYEYGAPSCRSVVERWERSEISTMEEITSCFSTMKAGREEMEVSLNQVPIDPALPRLLQLCSDRDYEFVVVSDGLRWYIHHILENHGIQEIKVLANEIDFTPEGYRFSFPWFDPVSPLRGTSKLSIVQSYRSLGYRVVFIGDGVSDIEAIHAADRVYARDHLLEYARRQGILVVPFSDLSDLLSKWDLSG
jgi:2,3-diketo-5-methylthio-1-phosphopentane phosphatase